VAQDEHETAKQAKQFEAGATFDGEGGLSINDRGVAVIRPARTRHGPRKSWREEFVQLAIQAMQGANPDQDQNQSQLYRDVNGWLQNDPDWRARFGSKQVSRQTVRRALKTVRP
jgi:hypothetical protein